MVKNDDLIVIPRKEYEALLRAKKSESPSDIIVKRTMRVPKRLEKFYDKVDQELTEALREIKAGKVSKSFSSIKELRQSLES
ncbi:MAG: hypothetical protein G01um101429_901 [Parcubacteria group bacterium Gr01-1014_29]|nr:MAG: hypothetical protein G01um101429_901 [Parcubacteria group bacterium Gr01-1014_29]